MLVRRETKLPFADVALGLIAGNGSEIVAVPLFYSKELAQDQMRGFVPEKLIAGIPTG
jgi:hypothetical protein